MTITLKNITWKIWLFIAAEIFTIGLGLANVLAPDEPGSQAVTLCFILPGGATLSCIADSGDAGKHPLVMIWAATALIIGVGTFFYFE